MVWIDAHLHLTQADIANGFLSLMAEENLYGLVTGTDLKEWQWLKKLAARSNFVIPCYGLHPWKADQHSIHEIKAFLEKVDIIGEIGMDSVWCEVDLSLQEKMFVEQLEIAEKRNIPVVLHTKGQEKQIAEIIRNYTMPVLVHWYSSEKYLDLFVARDCYFTIGPDVRVNRAVQAIVEKVPLQQLFVETDGLAALEWVKGEKLSIDSIPHTLKDTIKYIAEVKLVSVEEVKKQMVKNLTNFAPTLKNKL